MKREQFKILNNRGVTAVLVALVFTVFLGIAALAVDVGYVLMVKSQLQNAADAAALAGARQLGKIYKDMTKTELDQQPYKTLDQSYQNLVINATKSTASANKAAGANVVLNDADLIIGIWNATAKDVGANLIFPKTVKVTARRDASVTAGPISTFFGRVFGTNTKNVSASAIATLTFRCMASPVLPLAIGQDWKCGTTLQWKATNVACTGWTGHDANEIKKKMNDLNACFAAGNTDCVSPGGPSIDMFPGTLGKQDFQSIKNLFDTMRVKNDGIYDIDASNATWTTSVAVGAYTCDKNPSSIVEVVGYSTMTVTGVNVDAKTMDVISDCIINDERGCVGAGDLRALPSLVK